VHCHRNSGPETERVIRLEAAVEHLTRDITDIKGTLATLMQICTRIDARLEYGDRTRHFT
jgi:hypothetical protein